MPKVSDEYKDQQRAQILDAARRCFALNGFHATSMQDVFAEAGLSAGAVYRYFPKKADLVLGVIEQVLEFLSDVLRSGLEAELQADPGDGAIGEVMAKLLEGVMQGDENGLARVVIATWSEAVRDPVLAERLRHAFEAYRDDLVALVRVEQGKGRWPGVPAESIAHAILLQLLGFVVQVALRGSDYVAALPDAMRALWQEPATAAAPPVAYGEGGPGS
jgi:TetR/AcrR family transcriptional regulator, transcriptional repressor of aconitase